MRDVVLNISSDREEYGKFILTSKKESTSSIFIRTETYNTEPKYKNKNRYRRHSGNKWGNLNINLGKAVPEVYSVFVTVVTEWRAASPGRLSC